MSIKVIPKTEKQLHSIIRSNLNLNIPTKSICPGHSSPFSVLSDLYFEKVDDVLIIACRNGGKTVIFAVLEYIESTTKDNCESVHLGSVLSQANRAYGYVSAWASKNPEEIVKGIREKTLFKNGSSIEILPGTMNAVNSPHPQKASIDEFELLPWNVFQEAISMPKSGHGINSSLRLGTTRKFPSGNAQKMIDQSDEMGFKVYKWCIFEVMENCKAKPGKENCHKECKESFTYDKEGKKINWVDVCNERGKICEGYFLVRDVLKKFRFLDYEVFKAQWLCDRPEKLSCCFHEFNEDFHVIDNISKEDLEKEEFSKGYGWRFGRGWDFGYDDPTAVGFYIFNESLEIAIQIDEYIISGELIFTIAQKIKEISCRYAPLEDWIDWGDIAGKQTTGVSGDSYISKLKEQDISVKTQYLIFSDGIANVKSMLKINPITEKPRLFICRRCRKTKEALENSQWDRTKGENEHSKEKYRHDKYSHILDQLRYFISGVFDFGSSFSLWGGGVVEDSQDNLDNLDYQDYLDDYENNNFLNIGD